MSTARASTDTTAPRSPAAPASLGERRGESAAPAASRGVVLVTGATAGIGRVSALHMARRGYHVIATGRRGEELAALRDEAARERLRLDTAILDVTSAASIAAALGEVDRLTGGRGVDVLVNNAGFGMVAPLTEMTDGELRRQFETNVFGLMAVTRAFLPAMARRRAGRIINVSSVSGRLTLPFMGAYSATKYAVEALSDSLRHELHPLGIAVVLIEPGPIKTHFAETAMRSASDYAGSRYALALTRADATRARMDRMSPGPEVVARAIERAARRRRPAARYVTPGSNRLVLLLSSLLPQRLWDWAMRRIAHLSPATVDAPATEPGRGPAAGAAVN